MANSPSTNGSNGRGSGGRFEKGNKCGSGNPFAKRVAKLRAMILEAVTEDDLRAVISSLVEKAKQGDLAATRELLDRLVGRPGPAEDPVQQQLEANRLELQKKKLELAEEILEDKRYGL